MPALLRPARALAAPLVLLAAVSALLAADLRPAHAAGEVIYDTIPAELAPNYGSMAFAARQIDEFGDRVTLGGTDREPDTITIGFSSWACEDADWTESCTTTPGAEFSFPITVNIYAPGSWPAVGSLVTTVTESVTGPCRPSSDLEECAETPAGATGWYDEEAGSCQNGITFLWTFDLPDGVLLPEDIVVTVAFNTSASGHVPTGVPGPYDNFNVALVAEDDPEVAEDPYPLIGGDPDPYTLYIDSTWDCAYAGCADPSTAYPLGLDVLQGNWGWWNGLYPYRMMMCIGEPCVEGQGEQELPAEEDPPAEEDDPPSEEPAEEDDPPTETLPDTGVVAELPAVAALALAAVLAGALAIGARRRLPDS